MGYMYTYVYYIYIYMCVCVCKHDVWEYSDTVCVCVYNLIYDNIVGCLQKLKVISYILFM